MGVGRIERIFLLRLELGLGGVVLGFGMGTVVVGFLKCLLCRLVMLYIG